MQETIQSISSKAAAWNGLFLSESSMHPIPCASSPHRATFVYICLHITWKLISYLTSILICSKQKMIFFFFKDEGHVFCCLCILHIALEYK